jgi:glycosyltransferase involved in cell wall biosynthesis
MNSFTYCSDVEMILLIAAIVLLIIQTAYHFGLYNNIYRLLKARATGDASFSEELPPLSIIISAHDESENLRRNLPAILEQDYPNFEVIVINDGSTDETDDVLKLFSNQYSNLYHSFTPSGSRYLSSKKLAITLGVKAAKYDWLVFTEADCAPQSNQWLRLLARNFSQRTDIVLGYCGAANTGKKKRIIAFDRMLTAMRYLGFAIAGSPYMGLGRNMAYRKSLFYKEKGFSRHLDLLRGEDDLFINNTATSLNTKVEADPNAAVRVDSSTKMWNAEKTGYIATGRELKGSQRYLNGLETLTRVLFYITLIAGIVAGIATASWIGVAAMVIIFALRWILFGCVVGQTAKALGELKCHSFMIPVYDIALIFESLTIRLTVLFKSKREFSRK